MMAEKRIAILMCPVCRRVQNDLRTECFQCGRTLDESWKEIPTMTIGNHGSNAYAGFIRYGQQSWSVPLYH